MPISGTVITFNEEDHIEQVIASLRRVCDDVVVVDSNSTDRTVEIAQRLGATVVSQAYLGEGKQRNVTEQHAAHDWILALDADERLDDEMVRTIKALPLDDARIGYEFNRKSYCGQHWIKGPGFYPDHIVRLYNRRESNYIPKYSHAGVTAQVVRRAAGHIEHYTYDDLTDWLAKLNHVTSLDAQGMFEKGRKPSRAKPIISALAAFVQKFILSGGAFRGMDGITITLTSVLRHYMKYMKLNELHDKHNAASSAGTRGDD